MTTEVNFYTLPKGNGHMEFLITAKVDENIGVLCADGEKIYAYGSMSEKSIETVKSGDDIKLLHLGNGSWKLINDIIIICA